MKMSPRTMNEIIENKQQFLRDLLLDVSDPRLWYASSESYRYRLEKGAAEKLKISDLFIDGSGITIYAKTWNVHLLGAFLGTDLEFHIGQLYKRIMDYYFEKVVIEMCESGYRNAGRQQ